MNYKAASQNFSYDQTTGVVRWRVATGGTCVGDIAGNATKRYVWVKYKGRYYSGHHIAWLLTYKKPAPSRIDHKNGDTFDNRISNLRLATQAQNSANRRTRRDNACGLKGVQRRGPDKWRARIFLGGKSVNLGHYKTASEAQSAYSAAAKKHFGEFARD